uniref:Uncharacterized protein n=1 Tax=mine drainage metagenome TaxID=410659 RepID=E6PQS7_9ZZZZ
MKNSQDVFVAVVSALHDRAGAERFWPIRGARAKNPSTPSSLVPKPRACASMRWRWPWSRRAWGGVILIPERRLFPAPRLGSPPKRTAKRVQRMSSFPALPWAHPHAPPVCLHVNAVCGVPDRLLGSSNPGRCAGPNPGGQPPAQPRGESRQGCRAAGSAPGGAGLPGRLAGAEAACGGGWPARSCPLGPAAGGGHIHTQFARWMRAQPASQTLSGTALHPLSKQLLYPHLSSPAYRRGFGVCAPRVNLDGSPAGAITPEHRDAARQRRARQP